MGPPSTFLLNLFMDTILFRTKKCPQLALSSLFVDDVLGLSKAMQSLQRDSLSGAKDYDMI